LKILIFHFNYFYLKVNEHILSKKRKEKVNEHVADNDSPTWRQKQPLLTSPPRSCVSYYVFGWGEFRKDEKHRKENVSFPLFGKRGKLGSRGVHGSG